MNRPVRQTTRDLRRHNRSALLSRLYLQGPTSRQDLIGASGLSSATVSNVVADLIADGLVMEAGLVDSDGGRPRTLVRVRGDVGFVAGVDIGETHVQIGLFDFMLTEVGTAVFPLETAQPAPELIADLLVRGVKEVTGQVGVDPADLLGVGVGVPGAVVPGQPELVYAPTLGWSGVPLAALVRPHLDAPLQFDNCARTLGQAEVWRGAGQGARRAIVALLGVGVGAALVTESDSLGGVTSTTSEWGHMVVNIGGRPCRCGSRGCLEAYVGAEAILDDYLRLPGATAFRATGTEARLAELIADSVEPGPAAQTLDTAAEVLGIGIAGLVNLLNPDHVVLSGWVGLALGPKVLSAVEATVRRHALPYLAGNARIVVGELGPEAVAMGAATMPVVRLLMAGGVKEVANGR
ncbi:ROK family transcriptional regulator [Fodinicola feengrottensis]|uniref:ROK family transcriptional regulator n=1 Tax=Fodinicola feengrottensis TaxID=435914 RepID=A0ABN2G3E0_9ACTN